MKKENPKNGLHTEYYFSFNPLSTPRKKYEKNYKDGKMDGGWTEFHRNGQIKSEAIHKNGECVSGDCPS